MSILFEPLNPIDRISEYKRYSSLERAQVIYGYLFEGLSHRGLDEKYLFLNADNSKGYQSMGILHHVGITGKHKGVFSNTNLSDAIHFLDTYNDANYDLISKYLKQYSYLDTKVLNTKKQKYLSEVIEALNYFGGEASLIDIYTYIKSNYEYTLSDEVVHSSIRKAIYHHSSDADLFEGKNDLFYSIKGKGHGLWGLRTYIPTLNQIDLTEDDNGYPEGKQQLRIHLIRERDPRVIREAKRRYKQKNEELSCQACGFNFVKVYGEIGEDYIEGHHINPVSDQETESITRIEDIALLCSNCHKMIHRRRPWLCLDELKKLIVKS